MLVASSPQLSQRIPLKMPKRIIMNDQVFLGLFSLQLLVVSIGAVSLLIFVWRRKWFPINTRKPFLTVICFLALSIYCITFAVTIGFPDVMPCWTQSVINLGALIFYDTILIRTSKLWFQGRLAEEKFAKQTASDDFDTKKISWFLKNRHLVRDSYLLG
jgi:hypothetical protein